MLVNITPLAILAFLALLSIYIIRNGFSLPKFSKQQLPSDERIIDLEEAKSRLPKICETHNLDYDMALGYFSYYFHYKPMMTQYEFENLVEHTVFFNLLQSVMASVKDQNDKIRKLEDEIYLINYPTASVPQPHVMPQELVWQAQSRGFDGVNDYISMDTGSNQPVDVSIQGGNPIVNQGETVNFDSAIGRLRQAANTPK